MSETSHNLTHRYDKASWRWRDKMRTLGYYDSYLGFLSIPGQRPESPIDVLDIGSGTGAFAEAWVAINGAPQSLTLLEPSTAMLDRANDALKERGVTPLVINGTLEEPSLTKPADEVLVAHVIEHCPDPSKALAQIRALTRTAGRLHLVVSKPHWCNAIIWLQWRHRTFEKGEIRDLLEQSGYDIEMEYPFPSGPASRTSFGLIARAI